MPVVDVTSGTKSHTNARASNEAEHWINYIYSALSLGTGDVIVTYVYLDPCDTPAQIRFGFNASGWKRVYSCGVAQEPYNKQPYGSGYYTPYSNAFNKIMKVCTGWDEQK